jgi:hypothetical protein
MMLSLETIFKKNDKVPWRVIEGEAILVKVDSGEVSHLNEVATEIWQTIDGKRKVADIIKHIHDSFEVKKEEAEKDTVEFLRALADKKIIVPVNPPEKKKIRSK